MSDLRAFGAPRRYIQGPGVLERLPALAAEFGRAPFVLIDAGVDRAEGTNLRTLLLGAAFAPFQGEITHAAIGDAVAAAQAVAADCIVVIGGGKAIDTAKGIARALRCPILVVPSIASNDAPTSRLIVIYDTAHRIVEVQRMDWNPDVVLVDTALIARAPRRFLAAGIGDALSKLFEATACAAAGGRNAFDTRPPIAALALARACYETIRRDGEAALAAVDRGTPDAALENVVEAAVLLSGLGFESGGLSLAHSLTRGFGTHPATAAVPHGDIVAFGTLVQMAHERYDEAEIADVAAFCKRCGLPVTLRAVGLPAPEERDFALIVEPTLAAPHIGNLRHRADAESLAAALRRADAIGAMA